jgi:RNA polymerase sigma factor (TIGR02999 family)
MSQSGEIDGLLAAVRRGDRDAVDRLFGIVYADLQAIAHRQLAAQRPGETLDTTVLVHETYLKFVDRSRVSPEDRRHFLATAARAMRQIIIDYARVRNAAKRDRRAPRVSVHEIDVLDVRQLSIDERAAELLGIHDALTKLAALNARLAEVVELRFFGGFSIEEVAELLEVSPRTIKRDWETARAFLYRSLKESSST